MSVKPQPEAFRPLHGDHGEEHTIETESDVEQEEMNERNFTHNEGAGEVPVQNPGGE
jgi:hypothetical protein